jgi:hypothetical protein
VPIVWPDAGAIEVSVSVHQPWNKEVIPSVNDGAGLRKSYLASGGDAINVFSTHKNGLIWQ